LAGVSRRLTFRSIDPEEAKIASLTIREREIISLECTNSGATAKVIAGKLNISEHTVRNHLNSIYEKLGIANRVELVLYAQKHGLCNQGK